MKTFAQWKDEYYRECGGYKGPSFLDSGYFYCPYVPLQQTPVVLDANFNPKRGLITKYGNKLLEGRK